MKWPDGWRESTLRASGIPVTDWTLDVLSAWRKSTPVIPQTHNPLGMPARGTGHPAYLNTPYAAFSSPEAFRAAFKRFTASDAGRELYGALVNADSLSDAWRAIHGLPWPAKTTETDYPSALLDMLEDQYRAKLASRTKARRKTTGIVQASPDIHLAVRLQSRALHHAASTYSDAAQAIESIVRGLS